MWFLRLVLHKLGTQISVTKNILFAISIFHWTKIIDNNCWNGKFMLNLVCFYNEHIFVQLDELDELDKVTHAWIGFNFSLTQAQKPF